MKNVNVAKAIEILLVKADILQLPCIPLQEQRGISCWSKTPFLQFSDLLHIPINIGIQQPALLIAISKKQPVKAAEIGKSQKDQCASS